MSIWALIVLATALGGALLLWHMVSRTKYVSEEMLEKYRQMLEQARAKKLKELREATAIDTRAADDEPSLDA
jgi:hypothetical protein